MKKYRFSYNFRGTKKSNGANFGGWGQTVIESIFEPANNEIRDHLQTVVTEQLDEEYKLDELDTLTYKFLREES